MDIVLIAGQTFKIKGRTGTVFTDPKNPTIESLKMEKITFNGPGEYEASEISIIGILIENETVFIYEVDDLRICHLGNLNKKINQNKLSLLGDIDVLLISVDGESAEIVSQLESNFVIPFGYKTTEELDKFLRDTGLVVERLAKFSLKKGEYPSIGEEDIPTQIKILEAES